MLLDEKDLKNLIKKGNIGDRCLLYGSDSFLVLSYRKKIFNLLEKQGCSCEVYESRNTDFLSLLEGVMMISLTGERRAVFIDDFESSLVDSEVWDDFLEFCKNTGDGNTVIVTAGNGFDAKKKEKDKKIVSAFSQNGMSANIAGHTGSLLRDEIRTLCKRNGADLSGDLANYVISLCGEDLEILKNECIKLSSFTGKGGTVTSEIIDSVCSKKEDANIYNLASLIMRGDNRGIMSEINTLISQKTSPLQIIVNLNLSFYGLYSASVAKEAGKRFDAAAKDLNEKFAWRMQNYYRDSSKFPRKNICSAVRILSEAENDMKSGSVEERVALEVACARCVDALRERK